jgi:hypothetical protein
MSKPLILTSKADRDRLRQRVGAERKSDRDIATTARRIVREHLEQGRPAQACMADLVHASKGQK